MTTSKEKQKQLQEEQLRRSERLLKGADEELLREFLDNEFGEISHLFLVCSIPDEDTEFLRFVIFPAGVMADIQIPRPWNEQSLQSATVEALTPVSRLKGMLNEFTKLDRREVEAILGLIDELGLTSR